MAGFDWPHAASLQSALANAACSEIWVRDGVYFPTTTSDTSISFSIRPNVAVYGGFNGNESSLDQRDPVAHVTVLSGDIDQNDAHAGSTNIDSTVADIVGSNSKHVVFMDATTAGEIGPATVLDGFTITGGDAGDFGGGLYCRAGPSSPCSPTLSHLVFIGNRAFYYGGGLANNAGAGIASPNVSDTTFTGNAALAGGALSNDGGGGTVAASYSRVTFSGNRAAVGGAVYNASVSGSSIPTMVNATFAGNVATDRCGAVVDFSQDPQSVISPVFTNATFSGNSATNAGGAYCSEGFGQSNMSMHNVILWGNSAPLNPEISGASGTIDHAVVSGGCPAGVACTHTSTADPLLGPLRDNGGTTMTMRIGVAGSAFDAGDDAACAADDQRGVTRPRESHCDIGAVEIRTCHVDAGVAAAGDGGTWETAYAVLQAALANPACEGVLVARGVYKPASAGNPATSFILKPGVGIAGGFAASGNPRLSDPSAYPTVLSGDIDGNDAHAGGTDVDVTTADIAGTNSRTVVLIDATTAAGDVDADTVLDGLTITGGDALADGGGVRCLGSNNHRCNPTLSNLLFSGNRAAFSGGALHADGGAGGTSNPTILAATFRGNSAASGGAIYARGAGGTSSPKLTNVTLSGNSAGKGGAVYLDGSASGTSSPTLANVTFAANAASSGGNAMYNDGGNTGISLTVPSLRNAILWDTMPEITDVNASPFIDTSIVKGGCPDVSSICTNVSTSDPLLGALAAYGGATPTYLPPLGSPAIDAGNDATCPARDQRGATRPQGAHCDIGATESDRLFADGFGAGT
jgi:predicted outer membrane repeat protein